MPLTAPTWVDAIATVVLAVGLIVIIWLFLNAVGARTGRATAQRELTAELTEALAAFSKHLRQAADERRRAQACQVFIELDRATTSWQQWRVRATVHNTSQQPVYDLYVIWLLGTTRVGKPDRAARLLPGQQTSFERGPDADAQGDQTDPAALAAFLTFRDAADVRWTVREDGTLSDISSTTD
jgi:hypothetical protein